MHDDNVRTEHAEPASRRSPALTPYRQALHSRPFRRLLFGYGVSALGDGAGYVAVAWLATEVAAPTLRPCVVGLALAAYVLLRLRRHPRPYRLNGRDGTSFAARMMSPC
jgi:hypothetical protein